MKKMISILLLVVMCLSIAVAASAEGVSVYGLGKPTTKWNLSTKGSYSGTMGGLGKDLYYANRLFVVKDTLKFAPSGYMDEDPDGQTCNCTMVVKAGIGSESGEDHKVSFYCTPTQTEFTAKTFPKIGAGNYWVSFTTTGRSVPKAYFRGSFVVSGN